MLSAFIWIFAAIIVLLAFAILTGTRLRQRSFELPSPAWASFFSTRQNSRFLDQLRDQLAKMGATSTIEHGNVSVISGHSAHQIPLMRFAEACRGKDEAEWGSILRTELAQVLVDFGSVEVIEFERVKDSLRLQLGAPTGLPDGATVGREDLPGIRTILVVDSPHVIRTIQPAEAAAWHRPVEELFQIASDHLRGIPPAAIEEIELNEKLTAMAITGDSPFVAAQALLLHENPKLLAPAGSIVAVPSQHILLVHPIISSAAQEALLPMAWIATRRWHEGPGSISPRLYWYTNGRFVHLPYELNGEKFSLHPPGEFAAMLATLRGGRR
jgi:hypothetical protein